MRLIFDLDVNRLTEGNSQNQALKSSNVEVKFLTLAHHFSLIFLCFYVYVYVLNALIYFFSLGLFHVCIRSIIGC